MLTLSVNHPATALPRNQMAMGAHVQPQNKCKLANKNV